LAILGGQAANQPLIEEIANAIPPAHTQIAGDLSYKRGEGEYRLVSHN